MTPHFLNHEKPVNLEFATHNLNNNETKHFVLCIKNRQLTLFEGLEPIFYVLKIYNTKIIVLIM